jgi:L,D-peptidoglycan transpeptidase YkuD (ErfK/YbiS/YcfS/YnhG family)
MIFTAFSDGRFDLAGREVRCALGWGGVIAADAKREGDGASPLGAWPLRRLLYRADRGGVPETALPANVITPDDGWCDAPDDAAYNRPITHPYPASAERLWRDDDVYDFIVILGHNDDPVIAGAGSAIFLHVAKPGHAPTEGCVALARDDLEVLLRIAKPGDLLQILEA